MNEAHKAKQIAIHLHCADQLPASRLAVCQSDTANFSTITFFSPTPCCLPHTPPPPAAGFIVGRQQLLAAVSVALITNEGEPGEEKRPEKKKKRGKKKKNELQFVCLSVCLSVCSSPACMYCSRWSACR